MTTKVLVVRMHAFSVCSRSSFVLRLYSDACAVILQRKPQVRSQVWSQVWSQVRIPIRMTMTLKRSRELLMKRRRERKRMRMPKCSSTSTKSLMSSDCLPKRFHFLKLFFAFFFVTFMTCLNFLKFLESVFRTIFFPSIYFECKIS